MNYKCNSLNSSIFFLFHIPHFSLHLPIFHISRTLMHQSHRYKSTFYRSSIIPQISNPPQNLTNLISSSLTHVTRISSNQQETQESFSVDKTTIRITSFVTPPREIGFECILIDPSPRNKAPPLPSPAFLSSLTTFYTRSTGASCSHTARGKTRRGTTRDVVHENMLKEV